MADKDNLDLFEDFDRLLRQELLIEPSPPFAAGVRQRVDDDLHRPPWWRARWIPAIGSVATVASLAFAILVPMVDIRTSAPAPPVPPESSILVVEHPRVDPSVPSAGVAVVPRVLPARPDATRVEPELPAVLVDGRHRAALATLFRMMDQGRVSGDLFKATVPVSLDPIADQLGEIVVAPLVVSAIPPGGVLHNDNER